MNGTQPLTGRPVPMKAARNNLCPCGSGRKYKRCCGAGQTAAPVASRNAAVLAPPAPTSSPTPDGALTEAGWLASVAREFVRPRPTELAIPPAARADAGGAGAMPRQPAGADAATVRSAQEKFQRADQLLREGKLASAIGTLQAGLRLDPDNPLAHHDLGVALLESGKLPEAIASLSRAIELKPDFPRALHNLGVAYYRQGDDWGAIAAFRRAIALAPQARLAAIAHSHLGELLVRVGDSKAAIEHYQRAAAIEPRTRMGRISLVWGPPDSGEIRRSGESIAPIARGQLRGRRGPHGARRYL